MKDIGSSISLKQKCGIQRDGKIQTYWYLHISKLTDLTVQNIHIIDKMKYNKWKILEKLHWNKSNNITNSNMPPSLHNGVEWGELSRFKRRLGMLGVGAHFITFYYCMVYSAASTGTIIFTIELHMIPLCTGGFCPCHLSDPLHVYTADLHVTLNDNFWMCKSTFKSARMVDSKLKNRVETAFLGISKMLPHINELIHITNLISLSHKYNLTFHTMQIVHLIISVSSLVWISMSCEFCHLNNQHCRWSTWQVTAVLDFIDPNFLISEHPYIITGSK